MADDPTVVISFKDMETDEDVREGIEKRCDALQIAFASGGPNVGLGSRSIDGAREQDEQQ